MSRTTDALGAAGAAHLHDTAIAVESAVHARLRERTAADALNRKVLADPRVDAALVPVSDGLLLARKR